MDKKITCLAIDDEPPALSILTGYINSVELLELAGVCTNAVQALDVLRRQHIDLLFLDIQMPQILGTDFIRTLKQKPKIIFTTAYRKFAVEGFELNAVDYLLKPISFERFLMAVNRVLDLPQPHTTPGSSIKDPTPAPAAPAPSALVPSALVPGPAPTAAGNRFIHFRVDRKMQKVPLEEILYIESLKDYSRIVTIHKKIVTKQPISSIESSLPKESFIRIHRSFIVALDKIESYTTEIIEINRQELPIGRIYRHEVEKMLHP